MGFATALNNRNAGVSIQKVEGGGASASARPGVQSRPTDQTGARAWWSSQKLEGGEDNMWLDWDKIAPEDQAKITQWYEENRLKPFMEQVNKKPEWSEEAEAGADNPLVWHGDGEGGGSYSRERPVWQGKKGLDARWTSSTTGAGENAGVDSWARRDAAGYGALLRGTGSSIISGEGRIAGAGTPLKRDWDKYKGGEYSQTQVGLLNSILPEVAAKYGITDESAKEADAKNWRMQADRLNTHTLNSGRENAAMNAVLAAIAGGAVGAGVSAAVGGGTSGAVAGGAAGGAVTGGANAHMNEQNVAKGATKGAVTGAISGGIGSYANGVEGTTLGVDNSTWIKGAGTAAVGAASGQSKEDIAASLVGGAVGKGVSSYTGSNAAGGFSGALASYLVKDGLSDSKDGGSSSTANVVAGNAAKNYDGLPRRNSIAGLLRSR